MLPPPLILRSFSAIRQNLPAKKYIPAKAGTAGKENTIPAKAGIFAGFIPAKKRRGFRFTSEWQIGESRRFLSSFFRYRFFQNVDDFGMPSFFGKRQSRFSVFPHFVGIFTC